jgi:hypothetical protein
VRSYNEIVELLLSDPGQLTPAEIKFVRAEENRREKAASSTPDGYKAHKARTAARQAEKSLAGRDCAPEEQLEIGNVRRRTRCRKSLRLFCTTYNPEAFTLAWSADHLKVIARLEEAARYGALYAFAMPRGSGKTTIVRMAALWAISYALCRYVYVIGSNAAKAQDSLAALRTFIRFLPLYHEDFPEITHCVHALGGIANRASGQLFNGQPTLIEWSQDRIVLPTMPTPEGWVKSWPKRADGMAPTSGSVVSASGLTGDGIRGSLLTLNTGESIRPDLVLLDDPQTSESSRSPSQNETREQLVSADVLGMAGPGKSISAVMPCTVISRGDFIDHILDRSQHPLWRGERTALLPSMPNNMGLWDEYFDLYRLCAQREPPDYAESNAFYQGRRAELDDGAVASWPARKLTWEVSAVQHAMHIYCRDPKAFASEYQNNPLDLSLDAKEMTAAEIAAKVNGLPRRMVPLWATRVTAGVDVQGDLLYWVVAAWSDDFTGHVIAYDAYPKQQRAYFSLRDANPTLADATGQPGLEARIFAGLGLLAGELLGQELEREDGHKLKIERLLVDSNWQTDVIKQWARQSGFGQVLPCHGRFFGVGATPIDEWKRTPGERRGPSWRLAKHLVFDSNRWKSFSMARWGTPQPERGCLTLYGVPGTNHQLFAEHQVSESRTIAEIEGRAGAVEVWKQKLNHENHFLDALILATVGASVQGSKLAEAHQSPAKKVGQVSYKAMQDAARARR